MFEKQNITYLLTWILTYLIPTCILTYLPTYLHTYLPTYTYLLTYLLIHTYLPTYLYILTYLPIHTYLPTYLYILTYTYLPTYLPKFVSKYLFSSRGSRFHWTRRLANAIVAFRKIRLLQYRTLPNQLVYYSKSLHTIVRCCYARLLIQRKTNTHKFI